MTIINDVLVEEKEECFIFSIAVLSDDPSGIVLSANASNSSCCIVDDDCKSYFFNCKIMLLLLCLSAVVTIGFADTTYNKSEEAGHVSVTVNVLSGELARTVIVLLNTIDGTTTSSGMLTLPLVLSIGVNRQCLN